MRNDMMLTRNLLLATCIGVLALPLAACNEQDTAVTAQTFGPSPTLPAPQSSWLPTVNVAKAVGWPAGGKPTAANGMAVNAFATGLDHPRTRAMSCPTATCWWPRPTRRRSPTTAAASRPG